MNPTAAVVFVTVFVRMDSFLVGPEVLSWPESCLPATRNPEDCGQEPGKAEMRGLCRD